MQRNETQRQPLDQGEIWPLSSRPSEVWRVGQELWVVSKIIGHGVGGGALITPVSDSVEVDAGEDLAVKHYISGKTWKWWNGVKAEFIKSRVALLEQMKEDKVKIDEVLHGDDPR